MDDAEDVFHDIFRKGDIEGGVLQGEDTGGIEDGPRRGLPGVRWVRLMICSSSSWWDIDVEVVEEAVELGFGKGVGTLLLDGVLGSEDDEGFVKSACSPETVTCFSCMASRRAAWVLGGVRLISSARRRLAKMGPGTNLKSRPPEESVWRISEPTMSVGMRSGVNWMRWNFSPKIFPRWKRGGFWRVRGPR